MLEEESWVLMDHRSGSSGVEVRVEPEEKKEHHHLDSSPHYRVTIPPERTALAHIKQTLHDSFPAGGAFHYYKGQPRGRKLLLFLRALFPVLGWIRDYSLAKFKGDLIAGLTIASLCIPQDIGYAPLANMDPQYGLYSSFVPPLIYAAMGSSRDIAIGPVAVVSLLLGSLLQKEVDPVNKQDYRRLAFTATFFAGVTQAALGCLRLGFLIDFLSHAAVVGFMGGAAITIALQQLKGFLGLKSFTKKTDIVSVLKSAFGSVHHGWNWQTIAIASGFLLFLLLTKYIGKRRKNLFWVPAIAPLISVILSTLIVYFTKADKHGVRTVKEIPEGINPSSLHQIHFSGAYAVKGIRIGIVVGMVALTEAVAIGRTFAAMKDYNLDGNKEMVALGTMNMVGSMTSCYVATGSFSRSAVNFMAGCKTSISNVVMSMVVLVTLLFITPLFKYVPNAILASIIISAVISLVDIKAMTHIWKIDKLDFVACMGAFIGVVFVNVEIGLLVAVAISFAKIVFQMTRPRAVLLGNLPGTDVYRDVGQYPQCVKIPGILVARVGSAVYFSNANFIKDRILGWLYNELEKLESKELPKVDALIVDMSMISDIDTSGIHAMQDMIREVRKRGIQFVIADPGQTIMEKMHSAALTKLIGEDCIFLTVDAAVRFCRERSQGYPLQDA